MKRNSTPFSISLLVTGYVVLFVLTFLLAGFNLLYPEFWRAARFAIGLNFLNSSVAVLFFLLTVNKSNKAFIVFNLGGMVARIFFMIISIIVIIKILKIDINEFILVFFVIYFIQLFLEIRFYNRFNNKN